MKTRIALNLLQVLTFTAVLALAARNVAAQDSTAAQTAPVQLSYGVSQVVQLSKADVNEGTILNYIQNSGNAYGLDANQIVYLKQQGVSDTVINTMLNQPKPAAPAGASIAGSAPTMVVMSQPAPAPAQASTVYVIPDTQTYNYYAYGYRPYYGGYYYPCYSPVYYSYPRVSFSFGFGGGYRGGHSHGGWSGGYHGGGYHGGGGWHR